MAADALDCLWMARAFLLKDDKEILELLKKVLRIRDKAGMSDSKEALMTLERIEYFLDRLGWKDEKLSERLSMLRMKFRFKKLWQSLLAQDAHVRVGIVLAMILCHWPVIISVLHSY